MILGILAFILVLGLGGGYLQGHPISPGGAYDGEYLIVAAIVAALLVSRVGSRR